MSEVRAEVLELAEYGRLPSDLDDVQQDELDRLKALLDGLASPPSLDEVRVLIQVFPEDDSESYGFAWALLHIIESAPSWPDWLALRSDRGWWSKYLAYRLQNGGFELPDDLIPSDI